MAKAVLKYDLSDPDDRIEHLRALKSTDMALVIWDFVYNSKKGMEYQIEEYKYDAYTVLDKMLEIFSEKLNEHGIVIDDLVKSRTRHALFRVISSGRKVSPTV